MMWWWNSIGSEFVNVDPLLMTGQSLGFVNIRAVNMSGVEGG